MHVGFWWGNLKEGNILEEQGVRGRMVLKKLSGAVRTGFIRLPIGQVVGCCEQEIQPLGSVIRVGIY
jgi:hypothetical protein